MKLTFKKLQGRAELKLRPPSHFDPAEGFVMPEFPGVEVSMLNAEDPEPVMGREWDGMRIDIVCHTENPRQPAQVPTELVRWLRRHLMTEVVVLDTNGNLV